MEAMEMPKDKAKKLIEEYGNDARSIAKHNLETCGDDNKEYWNDVIKYIKSFVNATYGLHRPDIMN